MKKIIKNMILFSFVGATLVGSVSLVKKTPSAQKEMKYSPKIMGLGDGLKFNLNPSFAEGEGDPLCNAIQSAAWLKCDAAWSTYQHGALKYFNNTLCWINKGATSQVEQTLCHFDKSMGLRPDLSALPQTISKTFGSMTITVHLTSPIEAFAVLNGYKVKASIEVNSDLYMVLYWGGSGTTSKGFLIEGDRPGLGGKRASYVRWDLTDPTRETVQILAADYPSGSFLSNSTFGSRGDHVVYGKVQFNATTSAVSTQAVLIANQRGARSTLGQFGCFKMYASGTKDSSMVIAKSRDQLSSDGFHETGHATTSATKDLTDMDGVQLIDSITTANGEGNLGGASAAQMQAYIESALGVSGSASVFDKSCNDLFTSGTSGVFNTTTTKVNFNLAPGEVF